MQEKWHWKLDEFGIRLSQDVPKTQQEQTKRRQDKAPNSPSAVLLHQSSQDGAMYVTRWPRTGSHRVGVTASQSPVDYIMLQNTLGLISNGYFP